MNTVLSNTLLKVKQLRDIAAALGEGVFVVDAQGSLTFMNPEAERLLGWTEKELLGRNVHEAIHYKKPDGTHNSIENCPLYHSITKGIPMRGDDDYLVRKDGSVFPASYVTTPLLENGQIVGAVTAFQDITDRKQTELALIQSERRYRKILEDIRLASIMYDIHGKIFFCNDYMLEITGRKREEVIGKNIFEVFIPSANIAKSKKLLESLCSNEHNQNFRHIEELLVKDGSTLLMNWNTTVLFDAQGNVSYITCIGEDITERKRTEDELKQSEERFRDLFENATDLIQIVDPAGNFLYVNKAWADATGYTQQEAKKLNLKDILYPGCLGTCMLKFKEVMSGKKLGNIQAVFVKKNGELLEVEGNVNCRQEDGKPITTRGIFRNITERKKADEALRESEQRYKTLFENTSNPILVIDGNGKYIDCNEAALNFLECERTQLIGQSISAYTVPKKRSKLTRYKKLWETGGTEEVEYYVNGKIKVLELSIIQAVLQSQKVVFALGKDITEKRQAEEKIKYMAYHDSLTGLPNRVLFKERLTAAIQKAQKSGKTFAVLFLDIDRFKTINDTLGHDTGDKLLQAVADRLRNCARKNDTVARLGGDEFTFLISRVTKKEDAVTVAKRILQSIKMPLKLRGRELHITPSIGITYFPDDAKTAEDLLRNADTAMYKAKSSGRDTYQLFKPEMNNRLLERMELENNLHAALDNGEFELYYQPQISLKTDKIVGMEALIRWNHPKYGIISPMEFIPLAEETGLIRSIGEWVIKTACQQNKLFQKRGYKPISVAVNISARQFEDKDFIKVIQRILQETKLEPQYLELEITESIAMQDMDYTIETLQAIKELGIKISVDDFGVGYCSLNYLKRLPRIDTLKIDRSFINDINEGADETANAIVKTLIVLAKNLKLKVTAEGVETPSQLLFLKKHRCDKMQGFLYSRPVSAKIFEKLLAAENNAQDIKNDIIY